MTDNDITGMFDPPEASEHDEDDEDTRGGASFAGEHNDEPEVPVTDPPAA
jgi:hypothetical protein